MVSLAALFLVVCLGDEFPTVSLVNAPLRVLTSLSNLRATCRK